MNLYAAQVVSIVFSIIFWTLFVRLLLTWFPNINWYQQPYKFLKDVTEPILLPFQRIVPPIAGIDFSPMVPLLLLEVLRYIIVSLLITI